MLRNISEIEAADFRAIILLYNFKIEIKHKNKFAKLLPLWNTSTEGRVADSNKYLNKVNEILVSMASNSNRNLNYRFALFNKF